MSDFDSLSIGAEWRHLVDRCLADQIQPMMFVDGHGRTHVSLRRWDMDGPDRTLVTVGVSMLGAITECARLLSAGEFIQHDGFADGLAGRPPQRPDSDYMQQFAAGSDERFSRAEA